MIEINLLPEELKVKVKTKPAGEAAVIKALTDKDKLFIYAIAVIFGILVLAHIYFAVDTIFKNLRFGNLNKKWVSLQPDKKALDEFNREYSALSQDASALSVLSSQRIIWAPKLNKLSLGLPRGIWFNEVSINNKVLIIQGSVVSLGKQEINLINKLIDNLKSDKEFFKDFSNLEVSTVQARSIGGYEAADFTLSGALRQQ